MKRRSLPVAAALTATAALLLTACGSGDDKSSANDKIAGAEQSTATPTKSAEPSAAAEKNPDGVDVSLPKDINLVFDWTKPTDKNEAAAMDDAANYIRAIYRGVDKRTTKEAAVTAYSTGGGCTTPRYRSTNGSRVAGQPRARCATTTPPHGLPRTATLWRSRSVQTQASFPAKRSKPGRSLQARLASRTTTTSRS